MSSWMTVAIASGSSLLLHLFLLVILYLTPSPLVDEVADEGGIEDAVAQKLEEKKEDFFEDVGDPDRDLAANDPMPSNDNVAAPVMENEPVGVAAEATPVMNESSIPPPPGVNSNTFAGLQADAAGDLGGGVLNTGGLSGALAVGGIAGRSGGGKKAALTMGGGEARFQKRRWPEDCVGLPTTNCQMVRGPWMPMFFQTAGLADATRQASATAGWVEPPLVCFPCLPRESPTSPTARRSRKKTIPERAERPHITPKSRRD